MMTAPPPSRFKADTPDIPGVYKPNSRSRRSNPLLPLIVGISVLGLGLFLAVRFLSRPKPLEPATQTQPAPQIEVPPPAPDPNSLLPHADEQNPAIAEVSDLAKP